MKRLPRTRRRKLEHAFDGQGSGNGRGHCDRVASHSEVEILTLSTWAATPQGTNRLFSCFDTHEGGAGLTDRIAIVGTGPTGIYTFQCLLSSLSPRAIVLFERSEEVGIGMPYSSETTTRSMLANIASIEIPPIVTSYLDWLQERPAMMLQSYGLDPDNLDDRQFTPRLLLGKYFHNQLLMLITQARNRGTAVDIRQKTKVVDVITQREGLFVSTEKGAMEGPFDRVILATGHAFPDDDESTQSYYLSPWSGLIEAEIPAVRVGIMGTSLSSIDAAMAVAGQHGRFQRKGDDLSFHSTAKGLHITLMSWTGVLPEADFYCPLPYEPLTIMTDEAVAECAKKTQPLDDLFELLRAEINNADPSYAKRIRLSELTADNFANAYFAAREAHDPFRWARKNLDEVEYNKAHKLTIPWRYALLRMHEKVEEIVGDLSEADRVRFDNGLRIVFVDNYAAVPPESIRRLLALRDAGLLSVLALGENYDLSREVDRTIINAKGKSHVFDVFIDARGQKALTSKDMPLPNLRQALLDAGYDIPEVAEDYSLVGVDGYSGRLTMAALPYLMHDRPFVQGITACAEIGAAIAKGMTAKSLKRRRTLPQTKAATSSHSSSQSSRYRNQNQGADHGT